MGLSFVLGGLMSATPLQSFAAGAALCATSLGTTFSILGASGLTATRLGTVLTSAAMLDDVVGLILVQVISNLGGSDSEFTAITVVRPIAVSFGLVIFLLLVCRFAVTPGTRLFQKHRGKAANLPFSARVNPNYVALLIHTGVLLGFVAGATYAGTSGLFAVYLAGASIRWWDDSFLATQDRDKPSSSAQSASSNDVSQDTTSPIEQRDGSDRSAGEKDTSQSDAIQQEPKDQGSPNIDMSDKDTQQPSGSFIYEKYYSVVVERILKPFFFVSLPPPLNPILPKTITLTSKSQASIGFAIPITKMFQADIVWRGIIYTILMLLGKLLTGLWLVRFDIRIPLGVGSPFPAGCSPWGWLKRPAQSQSQSTPSTISDRDPTTQQSSPASPQPQPQSTQLNPKSPLLKPLSLYPASILGSAMVARGEIGFLISSLAESNGIFAQPPSSSSWKSVV